MFDVDWYFDITKYMVIILHLKLVFMLHSYINVVSSR